MVSSIALTLFAIAQLGKALPSAPSAFQVTTLNTFEPSGRPENSNIYRVGFSVTDPSDSSTTTCTTEWDYSVATTGYPSSYLANCTDLSYAFKFVDYQNYYDFKLDVKHTIKRNGKRITRFSKGQVNLDVLQCAHAASGFSVCNQKEGVAFPLPVYDVRKH